MEAISVAPVQVAMLPSPPLKRKSPPSPADMRARAPRSSLSPTEIVGTLALAAKLQRAPTPKSEQPSPPPSPPRQQTTKQEDAADNDVVSKDEMQTPTPSASAGESDTSAPATGPPSPAPVHAAERAMPGQQTPSADDYEKGLVLCGTCGEGIPFRDPSSGGFTLRLWDQHRDQCRAQNAAAQEPIVFTQETTMDTMANPPLKKRRAKRTEEERIEYLRTDPYVAQFEPYRVLCGSCKKWIRLRPNSTYCSIPWDAHRKSCLSKKAHASVRAAAGAENRDAVLAGDLDVRSFDPERVMCGHCDRWVPICPDGGLDALRAWYAHKSECRTRTPPPQVIPGARTMSPRTAATAIEEAAGPGGPGANPGSPIIDAARPQHPGATQHHASYPPRNANGAAASGSPPFSRRAPAPSLGSLPTPSLASLALASPRTTPGSGSNASGSPYAGFKDLHGPAPIGSSASVSAQQDARRRNAEQRAAVLRADPLLKEVEPSRVFCGLCGKWVQLRQDSSYCAYPWHQHRSKCLARYQRRQDHHTYPYPPNAPYENGHGYRPEDGRGGADVDAEGEYDGELLGSDDGGAPLEPESDEERPAGGDERRFAPKRRTDVQYTYPRAQPPPAAHGHAAVNGYGHVNGHGHGHSHGHGHGYGHANGHHSEVHGRYKLSATPAPAPRHDGNHHHHSYRSAPAYVDDVSMDEDELDAEGEGEAGDDFDMEVAVDHRDTYRERARRPHAHAYSNVRSAHHPARRYPEAPARLADLDTSNGRFTFILSSVKHLFRTTYERGDELSIGALVNYLNAAMPTDKHEDFDVQEVTRAAASLAKSGALVLEGDLLRPRD